MKSYDQTVRQMYLEADGAKTPEGRRVLEGLRKLETDMAIRRRDTTYSNSENNKYAQLRLADTMLEYWKSEQIKRDAIIPKLSRLKESYERKADADPTRVLLAKERSVTKYRMATQDQLYEYIQEFEKAEGVDRVRSPDDVEALLAEVTSRGDMGPSAEILRKTMQDLHYSEPFRYTDEGMKLYNEYDLHDVKYGEMKINHDDEAMSSIDIEECYDNQQPTGNLDDGRI